MKSVEISFEMKLHRPVVKQRSHTNFIWATLFSGIRRFIEGLQLMSSSSLWAITHIKTRIGLRKRKVK